MAAMLLFCSVYGFRTSEVCRLRLADFDWFGGAFTVIRSKNGRAQRFPIVDELREKVQAYLPTRPTCKPKFFSSRFSLPIGKQNCSSYQWRSIEDS
jgi:integrase